MVPKALAHHAGPEVVVSAPPCTQLIRPTSPPSGSRVLTRSHKKGPAGQLAVVKPPQQPVRAPKRQKRSRVTALIDPPRSTTPAAEQQPSQPADRIETLEQFAVAIGNPGQVPTSCCRSARHPAPVAAVVADWTFPLQAQHVQLPDPLQRCQTAEARTPRGDLVGP